MTKQATIMIGRMRASLRAGGPCCTIPATVNPLKIGGNAVWGEYFNGLIDEVRVYNRALGRSLTSIGHERRRKRWSGGGEPDRRAGWAVAVVPAAGAGGPSPAPISPASDGVLEVDQGSRRRHRRHRHRLSLTDAGAGRAPNHRPHHRHDGRAS